MQMQKHITQAEDRIRAAGLSVDEFCRRAGVARSTWVRWKQGVTMPSMRTWQRVVSALDDLDTGDAA